MRNPKRKAEKEQMELESTASSVCRRPKERERNSTRRVKLLERKLTGEAIRRNIESIWDLLTKNGACILGIYGMGGVGKTTIMVHIHNRLLSDTTFDVVYITVSQDFSIYKLQSGIGKALEIGNMEGEDEIKRPAMLSEHLERKKNCVLILDNVWERFDLKKVGIPIGAKGFKLVLTTRSLAVCHQMECQEMIKIEPLSQGEAESLFLEELGFKGPPNLEIAKSIVTECAGLPLGVITMAKSMRGATHDFEWRDAFQRLKESSMGLKDMEEKVLMILKFSYDRLGCPDVQRCFLSCALYPEDEWTDEFELVEFFIDQGLIGGLSTRKEQYDRGLTILNKLIKVCQLEDDGGRVKMHDLIRDMALHIMGATSIVKAGKSLRNIPFEECWTDALEKVSLMENDIGEFPLNMSPNCPKLSTLLLNRCLSSNVAIPNSFFKNLLGLKVLNLSENNMTELPNFISDLVNLRALLLRECCKLCCIPYLGKLTSLRKLDAEGCYNLKALEGLEKLVNLRYLDLTRTGIKRLPKGTLEPLQNLQYLKVWAVIEDDITKLRELETLKCYPKNADNFNQCVRFIEQSSKPRYYDLKVDLEKSKFNAEVTNDARFWYMGLRRIVCIEEWGHAIVNVGGKCTGFFILIPRDVQTMRIKKCNGITNLSIMGPLKCLEELEIEELKNLGVLRGGQDEEVIDIPALALAPLLFPSLRVLYITRCPKLKYLFGHGSKSNLPHLQEIRISLCDEMVGITTAVTPLLPHPLPFFPSLEEIWVYGCGKMKRVVESEWMPHFPALRSIEVINCEKMEEIIGGPPPYLPVAEMSLESLDVISCDNMRRLCTHECLLHLRNLRRIKVGWCKGMMEMIGGAGQGQEGSIATPVINTSSSFQPSISLPKLEQLELLCLPQLKSICEVPMSCNSMPELSVHGCPELKGKWKSLMWDDPNAQAILQPYLRKGEDAIELDARKQISRDSALEESPAT